MRICPACGFDRCDDTAERCRQCGADLTTLDEDDRALSTDSAFFHYLQIPKIGNVELVPGKAFRIGRERRNELVLPKCQAPLAATLFWTTGFDELTVEEGHGPEVIKVDGYKIKGKRTLKGGEDVHIGLIRMGYLKRATPLEGAIDGRRIGAKKSAQPDPRKGFQQKTVGRKADALDPNAKRFSDLGGGAKKPKPKTVMAAPAQVAKALEMNKATGTLRVHAPQGRGWITMVSGKPQYAAFGDHKAIAALGAILRLPRCRCQLVLELPKRGFGKPMEIGFGAMIARMARGTGATRRPLARPPGRGTGRHRTRRRGPPPHGRPRPR